jgi:hypothetical protein
MKYMPIVNQIKGWHMLVVQNQVVLQLDTRATTTPSPAQANRQPSTFKDNRPIPWEERSRDRSKCWYCPEQWSFGHKCAKYEKALYMPFSYRVTVTQMRAPNPQKFTIMLLLPWLPLFIHHQVILLLPQRNKHPHKQLCRSLLRHSMEFPGTPLCQS